MIIIIIIIIIMIIIIKNFLFYRGKIKFVNKIIDQATINTNNTNRMLFTTEFMQHNNIYYY